MERTRKEIQNLVSFLKFLSAHYKDEFVEELRDKLKELNDKS